MGLDTSVDHHVSRHELLNRDFFHSERAGNFHFRIEWDQGRRNVAWIDGVAQAATHRRVVIAVVTDRAVTNVSAGSPARISSAKILAPDLLQNVSADCRCIAQLW